MEQYVPLIKELWYNDIAIMMKTTQKPRLLSKSIPVYTVTKI